MGSNPTKKKINFSQIFISICQEWSILLVVPHNPKYTYHGLNTQQKYICMKITHIILLLLLLLSLSVLHEGCYCFIGSCGNGCHRGGHLPVVATSTGGSEMLLFLLFLLTATVVVHYWTGATASATGRRRRPGPGKFHREAVLRDGRRDCR